MTEILEGQVSMFDQDTWFGRTCQEPCPQTKERISKPSSPKLSRSSEKNAPMFLYLNDGTSPAASWELVTQDSPFPWHGEYMTDSFGEQPSTLMGECSFPALPNGVSVSHLSQILTGSPHPKYYLSERACEGILRRSKERGKALPEPLRQALEQQITRSKLGGGRERDSYGKRAGKGALVQTELSGTIGVSQDQTLIQVYEQHSQDSRYNPMRGGVSETVSSKYGTGGNNTPIVVDESIRSGDKG